MDEVRVRTVTIEGKTYVTSSDFAASFYIEHDSVMYVIAELKDSIVDFEDWIYEQSYNPEWDEEHEAYYMTPNGAKFLASKIRDVISCI